MKIVTRAGTVVVAGGLLLVLLAAGFSNGAIGRAEAAPAAGGPKVPPAMRDLAWRNGVWDQLQKDGSKLGVSTTRWVLRGKFQQTNHANGPAAPDAIYVVIYDAKTKAYRGFRIDEQGNALQTSATYDKATRTLTWTWQTGDGGQFVVSERPTDKDTIVWEGARKSKAGEVLQEIGGKMTRSKPRK